MVKVTFEIDSKLEQRFKKTVFKKKGMKRGNIKEAINEAIEMWISKNTNLGGEHENENQRCA